MQKRYFLLKMTIGILMGIGFVVSVNMLFLHRTPIESAPSSARTDEEPVPVFNKPFQETYTDPGTGLVCQPELFQFRKISVRNNQNPAFGTTVHYRHGKDAFADIYLYHLDTGANPVSPEQLHEHFQDTEKRILAASRITGLNNEKNLFQVSKLDSPAFTQNLKVISPVPQASYRFQIQDELTESHLIMFLKHGTLVKIRVTATLPCATETFDDLVNFVHSFLIQIQEEKL